MGRPLLASATLHAVAVALAVLLSLRGPSRHRLPPVYQVELVSAATLAPAPRRPEPEPEPEEKVEEETPPEPEAKEKVPDTEKEPEKPRRPEPRKETPAPGPEAARQQGPDLPVSLEGKPFPFPWYLDQLVRKVQRNWRPPSNTARATVYFRIARNGRISEIGVAEESGNFLFDQAARRAVEASAPMPPLPDGYTGDYLGVYFDFDTRVTAH